MPKRVIDEKTETTGTAREKAARMRENKDTGQGYQDEGEIRGIDEDLANPELERLDDEEDINPPPLDGPPPRL